MRVRIYPYISSKVNQSFKKSYLCGVHREVLLCGSGESVQNLQKLRELCCVLHFLVIAHWSPFEEAFFPFLSWWCFLSLWGMDGCMRSHFRRVWLFVTLWTTRLLCPGSSVHQAPLSSRHEYWSRLPCPPLGDLSSPGIEPMSFMSPALAGFFFTTNTTWKAPLMKQTHSTDLW